jgi:multidrug efflux pump subunit AcrB
MVMDKALKKLPLTPDKKAKGAAITVPMTLSVTVLIIYLLGLSFNIMTLGGMAAAVALIIDDAIVMIEHIIRRMREASGTYYK